MNLPVSLVIPLFNESETIRLLVDTIRKQTFQPAEIILVDGGSTDNTVYLLRSLVQNDSRFIIIEASNAMPGKGRNIGAEKATYEWIAFTDAGIKLDPHWLENLVKKAEENPGASIIYGNYTPLVRNVFEKCATITYVSPLIPGSVRGKFIASCLLKKEVWTKAGGFPDWRAAEDLQFMEKVKQQGYKIVFAPEAMVYWQLRPGIISSYKRFDLYSKHNVWAGRQAGWHYSVARQYLVILLIILVGIFHNNYWFLLLPLWIIARVERRIYMHRHEFGIKELFNPFTFLGVMLVTLTMDAGTFSGWIKAIFLKSPQTQNSAVVRKP